MDERRHGSLSPSRMSLQSLSEAGARQLQKQTSRSLLAAETRTVAASSSARVRLAVQITRENGLQNALLACEMLDELGLTCPCQTADGRGAGALVAALGEKGLSCLADPLAARRQNSGSLGSRCPHALPPSSPSDSSWLQMLFY